MSALVDSSSFSCVLEFLHKHLDNVWGMDTALQNFWAYMFDTFHRSMVTVIFPFLLLTATYAIPCGIMYLLEHVIQWKWLMMHKIQKVE